MSRTKKSVWAGMGLLLADFIKSWLVGMSVLVVFYVALKVLGWA